MAPIRHGVQAVLVVGALLGAWHLWLAVSAIFAFRNGEPWLSWVAILLGPGLTLLAVVVAIFKPRVGGVVLIAAACLSLVSLAAGDAPQYSSVMPFLVRVALPMAAVGIGLLALSRSGPKHVPPAHSSSAA